MKCIYSACLGIASRAKVPTFGYEEAFAAQDRSAEIRVHPLGYAGYAQIVSESGGRQSVWTNGGMTMRIH
jgi:hypothetical protein